jgi:hypothetical protein
MVVLRPRRPEGARERGMVVAGIMRIDLPERRVLEKRAGGGRGVGVRFGMGVRGPWPEFGGGSCVDVGAGAVFEVGFGVGFGSVLGGGNTDRVPCISLCGVAVVDMTFG